MKKIYKNTTFKALFWVFFIGSLFGTIFEVIINYFDYGIWETQQGLVYGPFNPIYGLGATLMVYFLLKFERNILKDILISGLICGSVEFLFGFLEHMVTKKRSWDYTGKFLNIFGYTSIPYMLVWGLLGVFLIYLVYPLVLKFINIKAKTLINLLTLSTFIFLTLDFILTTFVMVRHGLRQRDIAPVTFIGEVLDEYYGDDFMRKTFPDQFKEKKQSKY